MKSYVKSTTPTRMKTPMQEDDVISIQEQINKEYEYKLKEVNDEAVNKLKEVQEEHRMILQKSQELYTKKKEVNDLERQFNAMNKNLINPAYKAPMDPSGNHATNQTLNTQQMSFLNYSNRPERPPASNTPLYVKSSSRPKRGRDRDDSRNTFQMLNELSDYDRSASRGRYSRMSSGARDEYPENNFMTNNMKGGSAKAS